MMKCMGQTQAGDTSVLLLLEVEIPTPGPTDLLVKVKAVAVNPVDFKVRKGATNIEKVKILGWDASGIVEKIGSDVKFYKPGDEVYFAGNVRKQGCNAEYCIIDERITGRKPRSLSFEEAAAIPLTGLTAWEAFVEQMNIPIPTIIETNKHKSVLITAGAGGVGSIAIQIAKKVLKLTVIATSSRPETTEFCKKMGADYVIDHTKDLHEQLLKLGMSGVDYILECSSIDQNFETHCKLINPLGKICSIVESSKLLPLGNLMSKRVTFVFELMFTRPIFNVEMEKQRETLNILAALIDQKILEPRVVTKFDSMSQLAEAHQLQESGKSIGKIVLTAKF